MKNLRLKIYLEYLSLVAVIVAISTYAVSKFDSVAGMAERTLSTSTPTINFAANMVLALDK
ncbi:hypothetical protein JW960_04560 [candidate division KSB1 bacterium]|nr:hypothetical protein [candidate division KSB1 bacterium]